MAQLHLRRVLAAVALATLVSLTPASAASPSKGTRGQRAAVRPAKSQTIVQIVIKAVADASIRIDPNGIW